MPARLATVPPKDYIKRFNSYADLSTLARQFAAPATLAHTAKPRHFKTKQNKTKTSRGVVGPAREKAFVFITLWLNKWRQVLNSNRGRSLQNQEQDNWLDDDGGGSSSEKFPFNDGEEKRRRGGWRRACSPVI